MLMKVEKREDVVVLDPETLAALDKGIESEKNQPFYSLEESMSFARKCAEEWIKKQIPSRA